MSTSSPYPRLLESLKAMLLHHYRSGMTMNMLPFDEVHSDNPAITSPDYIDILADILPELKGANF